MLDRIAAACAALLLLLMPLAAPAILYDSGDVVNISSDTNADAEVRDSPGGDPTTLNAFPGAGFTDVDVRDFSVLNLLPLSFASTGVGAFGNATVRIYGGTHASIGVNDDAETFVLDATIARASGTVVGVTGGKLEIRGGTFQKTGSGGTTIAVSGGGELRLCGGVVLPNISGDATIDAEADAGPVSIEGGSFSRLVLANAGVLYGSGFVVLDDMGMPVPAPGGVVTGVVDGTITGTLADATPLSIGFSLQLSTTTLTLAAPPPTSICAALPPPPVKGTVPIPGWAVIVLVATLGLTPWVLRRR